MEGPHAELIYVDELHVVCQTELSELLTKDLDVSAVVFRRPTLWVTRRPDGSWGAMKLLPWPNFSTSIPAVSVEDATVEILDSLQEPAASMTLRGVNLTLAAGANAGGLAATAGPRRLEATAGGDHFRQVKIQALVDTSRPQGTFSGTIQGLDLSPKVYQVLPGPLAAKLGLLGSLRGTADIDFGVVYDPSLPEPCRFNLRGRLTQGRIDDRRLPHPLSDVQATVRCDNQGFSIDELSGRSGQTSLWLRACQAGYAVGGPLQLAAEIRQLDLDRAAAGGAARAASGVLAQMPSARGRSTPT